jgi:hypothetical protein
MTQLSYTETLTVTSCWCGVNVAVPENLLRWAKQSAKHSIYCPLGHTFVFKDSFEKKLEEERNRHHATRDLLRQEERSHTATRGHLTRQRKRAKEGVCPCCNRTFKQLAAHMKNKHPDFKPEELPS